MTTLADDLQVLIATEVSRRGEAVDVDTDLLLGGIVDSLGVIRIVHWLEETCGFEIDAADVTLENFQSIAAMVDYVGRRRQGTP